MVDMDDFMKDFLNLLMLNKNEALPRNLDDFVCFKQLVAQTYDAAAAGLASKLNGKFESLWEVNFVLNQAVLTFRNSIHYFNFKIIYFIFNRFMKGTSLLDEFEGKYLPKLCSKAMDVFISSVCSC